MTGGQQNLSLARGCVDQVTIQHEFLHALGKQGKQCFQRCTRCERFRVQGNHGSHYGNHHGNYYDNHSNHHGNYHAERLLFSCQCSKVSSCRVVSVKLPSSIPLNSGHASMLTL